MDWVIGEVANLSRGNNEVWEDGMIVIIERYE
jgi:hypothetical protein